MLKLNNKSIAKIEAKVKQKKNIESRIKRNEQILTDIWDEDDRKIMMLEIDKLQEQMNILTNQTMKNIESLLIKHNKFNLKEEDLFIDLKYMVEYFLVDGEITLVAAPPASGKSLTALKLADKILSENKAKATYYFDFDNGLITLKERKIDVLIKKHGIKLQYLHPKNLNNANFQNVIADLITSDLCQVLIVFDTTKNFINGDRDKNRDVSKLMRMFKKLRDAGATVLLLHHTNKPSKDLEYLTYAGSSAWEEDTSNAFLLQKNEYKSTFLFKEFKKRVGDIRDIAFEIDKRSGNLITIDFNEASETEEYQHIRNEVVDFIGNNLKCTYSEILKHVTYIGYTKDRVNKVIQEGKAKYWQAVKNKTKQNRDEYVLISYSDNKDNLDDTYCMDVAMNNVESRP